MQRGGVGGAAVLGGQIDVHPSTHACGNTKGPGRLPQPHLTRMGVSADPSRSSSPLVNAAALVCTRPSSAGRQARGARDQQNVGTSRVATSPHWCHSGAVLSTLGMLNPAALLQALPPEQVQTTLPQAILTTTPPHPTTTPPHPTPPDHSTHPRSRS